MRIGIVLHDPLPTDGGSYTFESTLLHGLDRNIKDHEFIILSYKNDREKYRLDIPFCDLNQFNKKPKPNSKSKSLILQFRDNFFPKKLAQSLTKIIKKSLSPFSQKNESDAKTQQSPILDKASKHLSLDMIWFLGLYYSEVSIPFFITIFDLAHRMHPWFPEVSTQGWKWEQREDFYKTVLPRASKVITGTYVGKREIENFYGVFPDNVEVNPFPVPIFSNVSVNTDSFDLNAKYDLSESYFLYPAQFWAHKNHINLLMAIEWVKQHTQKKINLVFVGSDKGNRNHVELAIERMGLQNQVKILGFVPESDLILLYKRALGLSFVSYFGPDNLPPLEAFALGCPVIAANVPGAEEQLESSAVFVDPSDPQDIGKALIRVSEDSDFRNTLIERGKETIKSRTVKSYFDKMQVILNNFERVRRTWN